MNSLAIALRSLWFHRRAHAGVVLGAAIATAVLVGALSVGDAVRDTLRRRALERLGRITLAHDGHDRFFGNDPGGPAFGAEPPPATEAWATALRLPALATRQDGTARANRIQVLGVGPDFWRLATEPVPDPGPGGVLLNPALARQLSARPGDTLILRLHKPGALSLDAVIAPRDQTSVALRVEVRGILSPAQLGNFSLAANQEAPLNAFVRHEDLARVTGQSGRANVLAAGPSEGQPAPDPVRATAGIREHATLADLELSVDLAAPAAELTGGERAPSAVELRSRRIFLEPPVAGAATVDVDGIEPVPVLTYLVNGLAHGEDLTPYSIVTAVGPPYTPADLADDEIVVGEWLAADLGVGPGDRVTVTYYRADSGTRLQEATNEFRVRSVVPLRGLHADRTLMPEFPGLAKAESTHEWDAGFPLVHTIRQKDEDYWKDWRGTPKAFISLSAGRRLWANRFGDLTGVRWLVPPGHPDPSALRDRVAARVRGALDPADLGLGLRPVRAEAIEAASGGMARDFGGLFIAFSFFLIAAALLLTSLLFQFGLEQRARELGTLLAIGWPASRVRRLYFREGLLLAVVAGVPGALAGLGYGRAVLWGLNTIWSDAVAGAGLDFHVRPSTLATGMALGVAAAAGTLRVALRTTLRRPARELLNEGATEAGRAPGAGRWAGRWMAPVLGLAGLGLVLAAGGRPVSQQPPWFFGAGSLLLLAGLAAVRDMTRRRDRGRRPPARSLPGLALRAPARKPRRSLATVALLAAAAFLIVAVGANRLDARRDAGLRTGGTGGFALWGETALPVAEDLESARGLEAFGLDPADLDGVGIVPLRVREGDEASCLNLNRAGRPSLLGVRPGDLASRSAFSFTRTAPGLPSGSPWEALRTGPGTPPDEIPAIGDAASLQWALKLQVGDTIDYLDENGRPFRLRIVGAVANSILQGRLVIDEAALVQRYPSASGHRAFLIEVPDGRAPEVAATLTRALQDVGLELTGTADRLDRYNAVQNTYLNTFQVLGGLGLLLGSFGLGVVVLRNVHERRAELGVLQAVGFSGRRVRRLVLMEHALLLAAGLAVGLVAALAAVLPAIRSGGGGMPWTSLALTLAAVLVNGLAWTWLATRHACRGHLVASLRGD